MKNLSSYELNSIRDIINNEINIKLNVLLSLLDDDSVDTSQLRAIVKSIVEKSVESWGFTPAEVHVIGPNDDSKFTIDFTIDISKANSLID